MKNKRQRLGAISEVLHRQIIGSQDELLAILKDRGYDVTQATLSRDLKALKVAKTPLSNGLYKYVLPSSINPNLNVLKSKSNKVAIAIHSMEFSGNLAVIKTQPGYANAVAWDIDNRASDAVIGTLAGDDTILLIPRDGISREDIIQLINTIFQEK
ncbi:MAG: arginine repressor [Paludibacteraceae bacterium]